MQKNIHEDKEVLSEINNLEYNYVHENFSVCQEILERLKNKSGIIDYLDHFFKIIENNPDVDFGTPGFLIHFIESFYNKGYEKELLLSLKRKVTFYNLWMLNRLINGSEGTGKEDYISILKEVTNNKQNTAEIIKLGKEFLENLK